jgi:hypothetical protein
MILWFIVGFIVWALCILFMLAIFKGGSTTHGYEQKLQYRNMVNTQKVKVRKSIRRVAKGTTVLAQ